MRAAIAAMAVRQTVQSERADIWIWTADVEAIVVRHIPGPVSTAERNRLGDWTLVVDDQLTARIAVLRVG
jgi:hypothetical protein